ncbi:flagellar basal body rod protein FlgC [Limnohabitans sp. WS1]|uniref:flagellar basal body rod protein FlgC n=1 Tax=Limnohabitans sp. WS1 TaxID=1100726 RepID=UPI000D3C5203|nr:flagellar basal body rod protein FlgC [Limnohabitans sp. WS1]PUE18824.1 flagellar basal body rod protein FlgC [Limnohabitans sp. WS1]
MSMDNIFGIAGTALNAQLTRMNSTASNLANVGTVSTTEQDAFRAKRPIFKALMDSEMTNSGAQYVGGVKVLRMADDAAPPRRVSDPKNPMADENGYVYQSNVSEVTEMVEMMAAARSYQNNVEVINTARQLMMRTLDITKA